VASGNSGDRERKGKGDMGRIAVGSETDFPTSETLETAQGGVSARFPSLPNPLRSLAYVDVATPPATVSVASVHAIAADQTVQARADRFGGGNGFNEYPNLNHVSGLPVVRRGREASRDNDSVGVFMKDESVAQREPPLMTVNRKLWPVVSLRPDGYPMKAANSTMDRFRV
jgi:hypothetical protein